MAETIASMAVRIGADISDFEKNMKEFRRTFGKLGQQVQQAGQQIGTAFTAAGGAIAVGLGFAVNKAMDFDAQMSRVGAISGATGSDLQALRQTALDLGAATSKSASEVAVGFELMAAKGYDAQQIIAAMPGVIAAAEASGEDMALVADTVASALNAFGLEASQASRVADVLAMSANASAAGVNDLQYSFKYAAPVANALGVSMEQLAAATGIMADAGMKGEQAGTTLRAALLRLSDPPKEARAALENLGISVTDSSGKFKPFGTIIGEFSNKLQGMTNAQKVATLSQVFGTEAATGMLSVIEKGPEEFGKLTKALEESGGTSQKVAALMKQNLKGTFEELGGAIETAQILFSDALAPAIKVVTEGIRDIINWFNTLSPQTQKFISIGAAVTAALLLIAGAVAFLAVGLGFLAAAEWAVILPMAGIIAAVTAGVVALIAIVAVIINYWEEIKAFLAATWQWLKDTAASVWESIKSTAVSVWESIKTFLIGLWDGIKQITATIWNGIVSFFTTTWDKITGIFQAVWNVIGPIVQAGWDNLMAIFKAVWQTIVMLIDEGWNFIKYLFSAAFLVIYGLVTGNWELIGQTFTAFKERIIDIILNLMQVFKEIWGGAFETIVTNTSATWTYIGELFTNAWNNLTQIVSDLWEGIKTTFWNSVEAVKSTVSNMWDSIVSFFSEAPGKIVAKLIELKNQVMQKWQEMKSDAFEMGRNIIQGMINGIMSMASAIAAKAREVVQRAVDAAKSALGIKSPSRVFMEIGGYTAEGMAIGMEANTKLVTDAASIMVGSSIPAVSADSGSSGGAAGVSLVVNVYGSVGVDDIGDKIVRKLAQAGVIAR